MKNEPYNGVPPRQSHSETSNEAACKIFKGAAKIRNRVFECLVRRGSWGGTDQEIQRMLSLSPQTEVPRRRELQLKGFVADSGRRRRNKSGYKAVVWVVTGYSEWQPTQHKTPSQLLISANQKIRELEKEISKLQAEQKKWGLQNETR